MKKVIKFNIEEQSYRYNQIMNHINKIQLDITGANLITSLTNKGI